MYANGNWNPNTNSAPQFSSVFISLNYFSFIIRFFFLYAYIPPISRTVSIRGLRVCGCLFCPQTQQPGDRAARLPRPPGSSGDLMWSSPQRQPSDAFSSPGSNKSGPPGSLSMYPGPDPRLPGTGMAHAGNDTWSSWNKKDDSRRPMGVGAGSGPGGYFSSSAGMLPGSPVAGAGGLDFRHHSSTQLRHHHHRIGSGSGTGTGTGSTFDSRDLMSVSLPPPPPAGAGNSNGRRASSNPNRRGCI